MKRAKYQHLLEDKTLKRWYDNLARGSEITADVYLRRLGAFCNEHQLTPQTLASMKPRQLEDLLMDYVTASEKKYAGSYIQTTVKVVKSWLNYNDVDLRLKIKIRGVNETPSLRNERVPTKEELRRILLSASKQARVASILLAHSGLRPETIGDYRGEDGLRIGDLPELKISGSEVSFQVIPTMVVVRSSLSKSRHQYFTFLSEEACEYCKDYLEERARNGEELTVDSAIVCPKVAKKAFIRTINIGDLMRGAIRGAGFPWRPYVLRSYFDTQLMLAESKNLVIRDYRMFWMGHKGDIENRYTTNKNKLPPNIIDDMREAYKKSQDYLQTTKSDLTEDKIKQTFKKEFLAVAGFSEEELLQYDFETMSDEELHNLVRKRLLGVMENNGNRQRVISITQVENYLGEGWEYVAALPNDQVIVRIPF